MGRDIFIGATHRAAPKNRPALLFKQEFYIV